MPEIAEEFTSPLGRLVSGDPWKMYPKVNFTSKQQEFDKEGKPIHKLYVGLAIPKNDPKFNDFWNKVYGVASQAYGGVQLPSFDQPGFAWKIEDGDNPKHAGKEGYANSWIVHLSTTLDNTQRVDANGQAIMNEDQLYTGCWVDIQVRAFAQGQTTNPSIFLSPLIIRRQFFADKIQTGGPSASDMEQGGYQAPAGASNTPVAGSTPMAPQQQFGAPAGQPPQQQFGAPAGQPPQQQFGAPAGQPPQQQFGAPAGQPPQQQFGAAPGGAPVPPQPNMG